MKITITINCDNAAFDDNPRPEIARILSEQAKKVRFYPLDGLAEPFEIRDVNGNIVGQFAVETN